MVEDYMGCFMKVSKSTKQHITRFFILDLESTCMRCFEDQYQAHNRLSPNTQINELISEIEFNKVLQLNNFRVGVKSGNSFCIYLKDKEKEIWIVPWIKERMEQLYQKFVELEENTKINWNRQSLNGDSDVPAEEVKTIVLPNGNIYSGELNEEGVPHGDSGREFCEDGSIYYGSFRNGKWHGPGCIINSNLDIVQREYIDGALCGI
ncbi:unnamed protein product [Blepharisma stoltei]|uniref:Uncharacterized protein n=1 Tax=Blepharisma stoltei TaxID=1481888 RepID=A0AAU9JW91_9CILI|nr:unnamed protein product [Blepharisma stoltei]